MGIDSVEHNCRQTGTQNELINICSRCGGCYVCDHHSKFIGKKWWWFSYLTEKFEPVILDGRLTDVPGNQP